MSGTIGTTPVASVTTQGIIVPQFADILSWCQSQFKNIYGTDIYLGNDSPDGQLVGIWATAINDVNAMAVSVFNSFAPSYAQGVGLSSLVKINGIARRVPSNSTAQVTLIGTVGLQILNGIIGDGINQWTLPSSVIIGTNGTATVTATSRKSGAITAVAGTLQNIVTPVLGWNSVTNPSAAVPGLPVETDGQLRIRQAVSTAIPSNTVLEGIIGALSSIPNVLRLKAYENDTSATDSNGVPSHSIAFVVDGGDNNAIANAIASKKGPGAGTYGTTLVPVVDAYGVVHNIYFYRPTLVPITVNVTISLRGLFGYSSAIGTEIVASVVNYLNALPIGGVGNNLAVSRLYVPAQIAGPYAAGPSSDGTTFEVTSIAIARAGTPQPLDLPIAFNEAITCGTNLVTLTVIP